MGIIQSSRQFISTDIEELTSYNRTDGRHVEMTVCAVDDETSVFSATVYAGNQEEESLSLSLDEARLLRDLLNRPEVVELLEESHTPRMGLTLAEMERLSKIIRKDAA
jgi:hypothetical protein